MSTSSTNLDSPDALRAFRDAMGHKHVTKSHSIVETIEFCGSSLSVEPLATFAPGDGNMSNKPKTCHRSEAKTSGKRDPAGGIKCHNCGHEIHHQSLSAFTEDISPQVSMHEGKNGSSPLLRPLDQEATMHTLRPEAMGTVKETNRVIASPTAGSTVANTDLTTTSGHCDAEKSTPLRPEAPKQHRVLPDLASEDVLTPENGGLRVPQNSPANATAVSSSRAVTSSEIMDDPFTTEEAHDVVIDIFKELAALSERKQAENSNFPRSILSTQVRQPASLVDSKPSEIGTVRTKTRPEASKAAQSFPAPPYQGSTNALKCETSIKKEDILPHLKGKENRTETSLKSSPSKDDFILPHLRKLKQQDVKASTANAATNYYAVLDPEHQPSVFDGFKNFGNKDVLNLQATAEQSKSPNPGNREAYSKPAPAPNSTPLIATESEQNNEGREAFQNSPKQLFKNPEVKGKQKEQANPTQPPSLPASFVQKWGSKGSAKPSSGPMPSVESSEDLENQLIFKVWPKQHSRNRLAAGIRTCYIKQLPQLATPAFVCSLVFGGALESVKVHLDSTNSTSIASVRFLSNDSCERFYQATANGLLFQEDSASPKMIALVTLGKEVDVIGGLLAQHIEQGGTRCVRAVPVDTSLEIEDLKKIAVDKGRQLESIDDLMPKNGSRCVVWRFCDVADALAFPGLLARHQDFESCNISFSEDPCALRKSPEEL